MSAYFDNRLINYDIILEKMTESYGGNEWFMVFKCLECNQIFLFDNEHDTIFTNSKNVNEYQALNNPICPACGVNFKGHIVVGEKAENKFRVTWDEINSSDWKWIIKVKEDE